LFYIDFYEIRNYREKWIPAKKETFYDKDGKVTKVVETKGYYKLYNKAGRIIGSRKEKASRF
tara:strand:- start:301 stop:486 length:186 start_codon:yes stop_codon:yes gene_type:complete